MQRPAMPYISSICDTGSEGTPTCASSDNRDQVGEDTELAILGATLRKNGVSAEDARNTVRRLAILRSAWRAGEITEEAMDDRADVMLRRLFARKPRALVGVRS